jgi:hypothetical protein
MTSRINTVAFQGIDVLGIDVQVQMSAGPSPSSVHKCTS